MWQIYLLLLLRIEKNVKFPLLHSGHMGLQITCARAKPHSESTWSFFKVLSLSNLIFLPSICLVFGDHSCSALTYGCCLQSLAPWHVLASLFTASSSLRTSLAHHNTLGPNCKIPPKIRLKNSWNCIHCDLNLNNTAKWPFIPFGHKRHRCGLHYKDKIFSKQNWIDLHYHTLIFLKCYFPIF